jgi:hypothetical protein
MPYEDYFFQKLVQNLTVASYGHFRSIDSVKYKYGDYGNLHSRLGALYVFGQGTDQVMSKAWNYLSMKYFEVYDDAASFLLFLKCNSLSSSEKADVLKILVRDEVFIDSMNEKQLFTLGMHFFDGIVKTQGGITTIDKRDYGDPSQSIMMEKNFKIAFRLLKKSAGKNYPPAIIQLELMYHCGYGVDQNIMQGEKYFDMILDIHLGYVGVVAMLYHTHDGLQNFKTALEW